VNFFLIGDYFGFVQLVLAGISVSRSLNAPTSFLSFSFCEPFLALSPPPAPSFFCSEPFSSLVLGVGFLNAD